MTTKVMISYPPGAGGRILMQCLEIMAGSYDSLEMDELGGGHASNNAILHRGRYSLNHHYPVKPARYMPELPPPITKTPDIEYIFSSKHYDAEDIIENLDKFADWRVLKICIASQEEADMISTLNCVKYAIRHSNLTQKQAIMDAIQQSRNSKKRHAMIGNLPENFIEVSYNDFYTDPEPYLRRLLPEVADDRVELAVKAVREYWKRQNEE